MAPPSTSASGTTIDPVLAAGVVLWHGSPDDPHFLLLQNARHGTWGLSKGHLKAGEDLLAGAIRETVEETGFQLSAEDVHDDFADTSLYQPKPEVWKRVVNFLAAKPMDSAALNISAEHCDACWVPLAEALRLVQFSALQRTLTRAATRLQNQ